MSLGLCQKCGAERKLYAALSDLCADKARERARKKTKSKAWTQVGLGRTPKNIVATIELDGKKRPVFEAPDRQQYVLDDNGRRIFGAWYVKPEAD